MGNKLLKYTALIVIVILISIAFTGTHSVQSVDDLAYAVALGIDKGENDNLKVTFQFTMPNASGEGSSGETAPSVIDSVEAKSIDSAINLMNTYVTKEINLSHCKVVVISEELARLGISKEIFTLMNKVQIRPDNNIIISKCTAKEYIESVSPSLENLVAKFYELLPQSSQYTGYTIDAQLGKFFNNIVCEVYQPTAILGNIAQSDIGSEKSSSDNEDSSKESSEQENSEENSSSGSGSGSGGSESKGNPNEEPISAKNGIENIGIAVFKEDKMVGTLTAEETMAHLMMTNNLKSCNFPIYDPENKDNIIDLYLTLNRPVQVKVSIVNGTPYISTTTTVNAKISSINNMTEGMSEERLAKIEEAASNQLKTLLSNYLYKTSKEYHADIAGFGKYALSKFSTITDYMEYDWLNHYQDAFFDVNAKVSIKSGFLISGT